MAPAELLHLGETRITSFTESDITEATDTVGLNTSRRFGQDYAAPTNIVEELSVTILSETEPDQLVNPSYFRDLRRSPGEQNLERCRVSIASHSLHTEQSARISTKLKRVREAKTVLPIESPDSIWILHNAHEASIAISADSSSEQDLVEDIGMKWLAEKTLEIARHPANASEAFTNNDSGELDRVSNSLGQITLRVVTNSDHDTHSGYEINPDPKTVELARQAVIAAENELQASRWFPDAKMAKIGKLIKEHKADRDTYKSFRHEIACHALTLAWTKSILEE
jgi:hypothetical protein